VTHLVLIGLMGVGKTTVGRRVAALLDRPFVDSDLHIEATTGRTVRQIAAEDGAAAMRAVESAALADALARPTPSVIGCAAGVVLDPANLELLRPATVVWLTGDPRVIAPRTQTRGHRPWLDEDPAGTLERMHAERAHLYQDVADLTVDVTPDGVAGDPDRTAAAIAEWFTAERSG
jgi:shikimate kinase